MWNDKGFMRVLQGYTNSISCLIPGTIVCSPDFKEKTQNFGWCNARQMPFDLKWQQRTMHSHIKALAMWCVKFISQQTSTCTHRTILKTSWKTQGQSCRAEHMSAEDSSRIGHYGMSTKLCRSPHYLLLKVCNMGGVFVLSSVPQNESIVVHGNGLHM
jgi:hypothetical protein